MTGILLQATLLFVLSLMPQTRTDAKMPPEPVVLEVLADNQLLLNFGSAQGTRKGEQLTVYRLSPRPEYVGKVEISSVGARYSLGRMSRRSKEARVGDQVILRLEGKAELSPKKYRVRGDLIWEKP